MFDTDFDPYDELMRHRHNIDELVKAANSQSQFLRELALQHEQLTKLFKQQCDRMSEIERELAALKSQRD